MASDCRPPTADCGLPTVDCRLGLYVHIPFCSAICNYCNFNRGLFDAAQKARYVQALLAEIRQAGRAGEAGRAAEAGADTIYFGGGTPSLLEPVEVGGHRRGLPRGLRGGA